MLLEYLYYVCVQSINVTLLLIGFLEFKIRIFKIPNVASVTDPLQRWEEICKSIIMRKEVTHLIKQLIGEVAFQCAFTIRTFYGCKITYKAIPMSLCGL